jgi:hypothetical protein
VRVNQLAYLVRLDKLPSQISLSKPLNRLSHGKHFYIPYKIFRAQDYSLQTPAFGGTLFRTTCGAIVYFGKDNNMTFSYTISQNYRYKSKSLL